MCDPEGFGHFTCEHAKRNVQNLLGHTIFLRIFIFYRNVGKELCASLRLSKERGSGSGAATTVTLNNRDDEGQLTNLLERLSKTYKLFKKSGDGIDIYERLRKYALPLWPKFGWNLEIDFTVEILLPWEIMPKSSLVRTFSEHTSILISAILPRRSGAQVMMTHGQMPILLKWLKMLE